MRLRPLGGMSVTIWPTVPALDDDYEERAAVYEMRNGKGN
jgi:hypothetical protein